MRQITNIVSQKFWDRHEYRADNTKVYFNRDGEICMQLWSTVIARINESNELVLNNGNYLTNVTKERLNGVLEHLNLKIKQVKGIWRIYDAIGDSYPFENGMRIKL